MSTASLKRLARAVFGLTVAMFIVGIVLAPTPMEATDDAWQISGLGAYMFLFVMFSFAAVGILIAGRLPRHAVGWILLAIGFAWGLVTLSDGYIVRALELSPGSLPNPSLAAAFSAWLWVPPIGLMGNFLILLFPDGHLPSPRWRPIAWISAMVLVVASVSILFTPGSLDDSGYPGLINPLGIESLEGVLGILQFAIVLIPITIVASAVALVGRFRRSRGPERLQLKWLTAAGGTVAGIFLVSMAVSLPYSFSSESAPPSWTHILDQVALLSFGLIPFAIGAAVLKYHLYDVDLIINRTLVYGAVTALLVLVYVGGVVGLGSMLRELTNQENNSLAVAASTLAVAALFRPARGRIQGFIDRRFYRKKYDAAKTLESFSARLRDEVDLDELSEDLLSAIRETMQPAHASLWLRSGAGR